ncbi:MAG: hypothetical protein LBT86_03480 [Deltaproteobacteria bacterium]|jgi:hypothetical protein|nr:hypothetical protein [Deltaproteobacteria bacterium]
MIFRQTLYQTIDELELILPLKTETKLNDLIIFLEERKKHVIASFAQIIRLAPLTVANRSLFQAVFCFLKTPLRLRSLALNYEQLHGRALFTIKNRLFFLRAIDMALVTDEATSELSSWVIGHAIEETGEVAPPDPDPELEPEPQGPRRSRPHLTLVK